MHGSSTGTARRWTTFADDRAAPFVHCSHSLVIGAAWSWRLLLVGVTVYAAVRVLVLLSLVVIPLVAALLLAALLRPVAQLLQRRLTGPLSALATLLLATVVLGSLGYLIGLRFTRELPSLIGQLVGPSAGSALF
ncbi:MAG: hypothetical protein M3Y73_16470 [Actinomycetota bacterium]|nr:hypothetical protein [Actinomycetota bacterium]